MATVENNNNNERIWTLACIDGSKYSSAVCDYAVWLSQQLNAPFKALHAIEHAGQAAVADLSGAIGLGAQEQLLSELTELEQQRNRLEIQKGRQMLESVAERAQQAGIAHPETVQRHGPLLEALIDLEAQLRVVVMGIRGEAHEQDDQQLGAHLESLVRTVHRPIFVVNGQFKPVESVMLAFDGSECCQKAVEMVKTSPLFEGKTVHLVTVTKSGQRSGNLQAVADTLKDAGRTVELAELEGDRLTELCHYQKSQNIDLTVMGAFSHFRLRELLFGSFTAQMLLKSERPLLLLR